MSSSSSPTSFSGDKVDTDNGGHADTGATQKDHLFRTAEHAALYAAFRPRPPASLLHRIADYSARSNILLDIGCGGGQSTEPMASLFRAVVGVDESPAQIRQAEKNRVRAGISNVTYKVGSAYQLPFKVDSFDVVTGSQCVHWFDLDRFYPEAYRVLNPGGTLAMYGYRVPLPKIGTRPLDEQVEERIMKFYRGEMGSYWDLDRSLIDDSYRSLPRPAEGFAFVEHDTSFVEMTPSTLATYISYLSSWSSYQKFRKVHPDRDDPLIGLRHDLASIYGLADGDGPFNVETNFFLLVYHKL